jgi:hypothetical protein
VSEQVRIVRIWLLAALIAVSIPAASARADEEHQGLQAGWAVDDMGNVNFTSSYTLQYRSMHEAETSWVRLNFRLGACFQNWISPGCNGRTALETYDEVVDIARDHGFQVLGLIGHEAWPGDQQAWTANNAEHARGDGDNQYLRHFADDAAGVLATHFEDRIRDWEIWNEPNTWTEQDDHGLPMGGSFIYPSNFAWALTRAYEAIKLARPDAIVISGGLFGHDMSENALLFARDPCPTGVNSGADYLCATYEQGLQHAGWQPGRYPFDHVGQHLYIDGGRPTSEEKLRFYLDDIRDAYLSYEGGESPKTTFITEFGWSTKDLSQEVQAQNLLTAFDTFREVGYVARAYWFGAQDVPEAGLFYGLLDASGQKKPAFNVYLDAAAYDSTAGDEPVGPARLPGMPARLKQPAGATDTTESAPLPSARRATTSAESPSIQPVAPHVDVVTVTPELNGGDP